MFFIDFYKFSVTVNKIMAELWDVYDKNRNLTGRVRVRGDEVSEGDFHIVVFNIVKTVDDRYLITQRSKEKARPLLWEFPGGSVIKGEDSLSGALRELREETGLCMHKDNARLFFNERTNYHFVDVWFYDKICVDLSKIVLQEGETCDARLVTLEDLIKINSEKNLLPYVARFIDKL